MDKRKRAFGVLPLIVALISVAIACPERAEAAQILTNPGFESGALTPWFQDRDVSSGSDWAVTSADAHSGTFSATDDGNKEIRQNFAPTPTNSITSISFFAKHPDAAVTELAVDFFYSDLTDHQFIVDTVGTGYNFFDVTSHLDAGKTMIGFSIFGNSEGVTFFDDASITTAAAQVPEPSVLVLLASGLTLLMTGAAWSRKKH